MFNINNFNDPVVWDLICEGNTKGVFQLESSLGKHWAKEVKPKINATDRNIFLIFIFIS